MSKDDRKDFKLGKEVKVKTDESIEENITDMINKLLHDSSDDNKSDDGAEGLHKLNGGKIQSERLVKKDSINSTIETPTLYINSVLFEQSNGNLKFSNAGLGGKNMSKNKNGLSLGFGGNISQDEELIKLKKSNTLNSRMTDTANIIKLQNHPQENLHNQKHRYEKDIRNSDPQIGTMQFSQPIIEMEEILENKVRITEKVDEESLHCLKGNFLKIVKSQNGSRILQKALNKTHSSIFSIIFEEIKGSLADLLVDSYANYFCQKFYDFLNNAEKIEFLTLIKDQLVSIGNSTIGTYPLQAIIDQMKTKEERKIISAAVKANLMEMSQHAQGTHVVEKVIICFDEESIKDIYELVINNFIFLACHCNGFCITKKIVSCCKSSQNLAILQKLLIENADMLIQNTHGSYSIQVALDTWDYELISPIINLFYNKFFTLSSQKYSSNIVEKCLERGGEGVMSKFMEEVCHKSRMLELMKNSFGNYVIQKALKLSTGFYRGKMIGIIKKHIEKLHDKKLAVKWKNILNNQTSNNLNLNTAGMKRRDSNGSVSNDNNDSGFASSNSSLSGVSVGSPNSQRSNNSFTSTMPMNNINMNNPFMPITSPVFINHFAPVNFNNLNFKGSKSAFNSPNHSYTNINMNSYSSNNFNLENPTINSNINSNYQNLKSKLNFQSGTSFYPSSFK